MPRRTGNGPLTIACHSGRMSTSQHAARAAVRGVANAAAQLALAAALLFTVTPVRAETDLADAERIALERIPGKVVSIQRSYGMFRVGVRTAAGLKYELSIDIARGSVQRVRPAR